MRKSGDGPSLRRGFCWRMLSTTVLLSVPAAAIGWSLAFHSNYAAWPFLEVGERISWCGQDYRRGATDLTLAEVNLDSDRPVQKLFRYPPKLSRNTVFGHSVPSGCPDRLFLRVAKDRYSVYLTPNARP